MLLLSDSFFMRNNIKGLNFTLGNKTHQDEEFLFNPNKGSSFVFLINSLHHYGRRIAMKKKNIFLSMAL